MEERLKTKQRSATVSNGSGSSSRAPLNDRQPQNAVNARQLQKGASAAIAGRARPSPNTAANSRRVHPPRDQESSEEEEDSDEQEEEEEEDSDEENSDTEDSSSAEESK